MQRALAAVAVFALAVTAGCAGSRTDPAFDAKRFVADVSQFQNDPSEATWIPVRGPLVKTPPNPAVVSTAVEALIAQPVPERVLDAAAVDLATADWTGAMRFVRQYNVVSGTGASARGRAMATATARLAWLLLALRPSYAKDPVDLTHADLRDSAPFVGQAMNLTNVDFSETTLNGGMWHGTNVGGAQFASAAVAGTLHCANCTFGNVRYPGTVTLTNGQWTAH